MLAAIIGIGGILVLFVFAQMWAAKKAADAATGKAAKEAINDITNANRPLSDVELERVRQRWKRD